MTYKVTEADAAHLTLNERDTVTSVLQNIAVILKTIRGSVPHYRAFGLPGDFIDRPIPAAKPLMHAAVKEAVEMYEPRAEVVGVTFIEDIAIPGRLIPTVEVKIIGQ